MTEGPGVLPSSGHKVFLSYAHDDESHRSAVLDLANLLEVRGVSVEFDRWHEDLRIDWYAWMLREIQAPIREGKTYHLKITATGPTIRVYLDGATSPVIDTVDSAYASGRFGLNTFAGTSTFANATVS